MIPALVHWEWWLRWTETRIVTEDGVFADTFVPSDYGGPQLTIKVIQRVIHCTEAGHFHQVTYGNTVGVLDNTRATGMGIYIEGHDPAQIVAEEHVGPGPSGEWVQWKVEENALLTQELRDKLTAMYPIALGNMLVP